jgi:hypothetical protein
MNKKLKCNIYWVIHKFIESLLWPITYGEALITCGKNNRINMILDYPFCKMSGARALNT